LALVAVVVKDLTIVVVAGGRRGWEASRMRRWSRNTILVEVDNGTCRMY
jgi:hypothetical protein